MSQGQQRPLFMTDVDECLRHIVTPACSKIAVAPT